MGSFLSIPSREKRRRSNRLSKPPSSKATSVPISSRSPPQPADCALPLLSNPAIWQDPWTGTSIPVSPSGIESNGGRSQSFPSTSAHSETPWTITSRPANQPVTQNIDELYPQSPVSTVSTTSSMHRAGSLYRRASFQPSRLTTFQPTTLQSCPVSPIVGHPQRSFSVHSPPHRARSTVHHSLEEATSSNTHFRVDSQGFSLIRRRSLLTRPGVATRRSAKETIQRYSSEGSKDTIFSRKHQATTLVTPPTPLPDQEVAPKPSLLLPQNRPPTPSDYEVGYTHLGALKLGSLRVVNGSASPCSSHRTLHRPGSPEVVQSSQQPVEIINFRESLNFESKVSPDFIRESADHKHPPTTTLQIPTSPDAITYQDFPASPFSFEKSPTVTTQKRMSIRAAEDEGISILDEERRFIPLPEKAPERNLSYRRFSHSHRKADSGYSSAASVRSLQGSHRNSIDSQTSPQRSAKLRRFTLGGSSRDLEVYNAKMSAKLKNQLPINRHLSLQGPRMSARHEQNGWSTSTSTMCHEPQQMLNNGRFRSSSLTAAETSSRMLSLPPYCSQLRGCETPASRTLYPTLPRTSPAEMESTRGSLYNDQRFGVSNSIPRGQIPQLLPGRDFGMRDDMKINPPSQSGYQFNNHQQGTIKAANLPQSTSQNRSPEKLAIRIPSNQEEQSSSDRSNKIHSLRPANGVSSLSASRKISRNAEISGSEPPRGRTRSRSIEYQRYMSSKQQRPKVYA